MKSYRVPLSSDAFTGFEVPADRMTSAEEVVQATHYLLGTVIPEFARVLIHKAAHE